MFTAMLVLDIILEFGLGTLPRDTIPLGDRKDSI